MAAGNGICKWRTQVSKSVKNGQKMRFFGIYGCQVFLARFEPMVARYDAPQFQNALKMGFLGTKKGQKWVKNTFFQNDN